MFNKSKFYFEWIEVIEEYWKSLDIQTRCYEIFTPCIVSIVYSCLYFANNTLQKALENFANILPNVLSILIGFTITILMVMPSIADKLLELRKNENDKLSPYMQLLSQFSFNVFSEVILLMIIFVYLSLKGLTLLLSKFILVLFFSVELFMLLNILFSTIRAITNIFLFFSRYQIKKK